MLNIFIVINIITFLCVAMGWSFWKRGTQGSFFTIFKRVDISGEKSEREKSDKLLRVIGIGMLITIFPIWFLSVFLFLNSVFG